MALILKSRALGRQLLACLSVLSLLSVAGCQTTPEQSDWLYHQLGQREGISDLNETLILTMAKDERIASLFADTDIERFHRLLNEQFCELSGGPCSYTGDSMAESHRGLNLTAAHFNALVEDLVLAMEAEQVPVAAQNRLLAQLAPMRDDVVGEHPLPPVEFYLGQDGERPAFGYSESPQ